MKGKLCIVVVSIGLCAIGTYLGIKGGYYLGYGRGVIQGISECKKDRKEFWEKYGDEIRKQIEESKKMPTIKIN